MPPLRVDGTVGEGKRESREVNGDGRAARRVLGRRNRGTDYGGKDIEEVRAGRMGERERIPREPEGWTPRGRYG